MHKNASIKRLLLKTAGCIGHSAHKYVSRFFSGESQHSDTELEIIERVFSMGFYADDSIETACSIALETRIFNTIDFTILVSEVDNRYRM